MKTIRKVLKKEKGFTLIELLIVIAIIGVLAVLIIPRVMTSLDDAKTKTSAANIKLVQSAVERYYFDEKTYPLETGGTTGDSGSVVDTGTIELDLLVDKGYIDEAPTGTYTLDDGVVEGS